MCRCIRATIGYCRLITEYVLEFFFSLIFERRKQAVPALDSKHAVLKHSAVELAKMIKNKQLKSDELVRACIERIRQVNPILNAVIGERYDEAIAEAKEIDNRIALNSHPEDYEKPFLGVPFTTKESQAVKGMSLTFGLWCRRDKTATEDSEAVCRMRAAGAIPIAVTNLPELLIWNESRNPVFGTTNNPHHTGRTAGGSSGGEAALMATYATPISLTSDVAGSTRIPSFFCGLFGYHPTANTTNMKGMFNRTGEEGDSMFCLGFLSKHMDDQIPLMKVIAGDKAPMLNLDKEVNVKNIKVYYTESFNDIWMSDIRSELKKALKDAVHKLEACVGDENGAIEYYHKAFDDSVNLWRYWMIQEPEDYFSMYTDGNGKPWIIWEIIKKLLGCSKHNLNLIFRLAGLRFWPAPKPNWAEPLTKSLKDDLFMKLGHNGVLILPSGPIACPYHYFPYVGPYNFGYWAIVNVLKCPAVQVPLGRNEKGLPIGIQVLAAPNNDALCIAVAKHLEQEFGGAVMACNA